MHTTVNTPELKQRPEYYKSVVAPSINKHDSAEGSARYYTGSWPPQQLILSFLFHNSEAYNARRAKATQDRHCW